MCGILAYFKADGIGQDDLQKALRGLDNLAHRGPDGAGAVLINSQSGECWTLRLPQSPGDLEFDLSPEAYEGGADLFLGHRRLSIFDLSSKGHQPMRDEGGNWLIFNGEVYNFLDLRPALEQKGYQFRSATDTEVLMAAYREQGEQCLQTFNGMYSFLLWDSQKRQLFVANDRFGIKPLYSVGSEKEWVYSSQVRAMGAMGMLKPDFDLERLRLYVFSGMNDYDQQTLIQGVEKFPQGHYALHSGQGFADKSYERYWDYPSGRTYYKNPAQAAEAFGEIFQDAVRLRMVSDVEWGTSLSGGLDSSAIVYMAAKLLKEQGKKRPIYSFSAVFPGLEGDESSFVDRIRQDLDLQATMVEPVKEFGLPDFEKFMSFLDFPVRSTAMYAAWCVMRAVGKSPVTVLLDGQGGDELFGGYHHHFYKYARYLILRGQIRKAIQEMRYYAEMKGKTFKEIRRLVVGDLKLFFKLKMGPRKDVPEVINQWDGAYRLKDVLQLDLKSNMMPELLRYEDRTSMAYGVEARVPFLDHRLVEFAFTLPDKYKINKGWQKWVIREALPEMPDEIRWRKDKKGYSTPFWEWVEGNKEGLRSYLSALENVDLDVKSLLTDGAQTPDELFPDRFYRLCNLGLWSQQLFSR